MSGTATRTRITQAALSLFNKQGIQNVTLQLIADEAGISVGNLAYHFHDKEQILKKIGHLISEDMDKLLSSWEDLPGLLDFDNQLTKLYYLLDNYSFYFLDILEIKRLYPVIHIIQQDYIRNFTLQMQQWFENGTKRGFIVKLRDEQTRNIAEMIWFISSFWMTKKKILEKDEFYEGAFKDMIWQQIRPFLTEEADTEFELIVYPGLIS
jgi:AcrR family transcriptional regulator